MVIGVIIVGILIFALIILMSCAIDNGGSFETGTVLGLVLSVLFVIELCLVGNIIKTPTPSALDVYRGNTELEITSVNGTPIDTVVVFKKELK